MMSETFECIANLKKKLIILQTEDRSITNFKGFVVNILLVVN